MDSPLLPIVSLLGENDLLSVTSQTVTGELADITHDYTLSGELDAEEMQAHSFQVRPLRHQRPMTGADLGKEKSFHSTCHFAASTLKD